MSSTLATAAAAQINSRIQSAKAFYNQLESKASQFNKDHEKNDFDKISKALNKGINSFTSAHEAFKSGDAIGASQALLQGIGSVTGLLMLAGGPIGALVGEVLNVVIGIISAILDALKPPTESLISKIEKLIQDETLRVKKDELSSAFSSWEQIEIDIAFLIKEGKLQTWEDASKIDWDTLYNPINNCLETLASHRAIKTKEWLPLFDLCIIYTIRYWVALQQVTLHLFIREKPDATSPQLATLLPNLNSAKTYFEKRQKAANTLY